MGDEGGGAAALSHLLEALSNGVDVHQAVVRAYRQEGAIWRELQLMDDLLPVLNMHNLGHVPAEEEVLPTIKPTLPLQLMKLVRQQ